MRQSHFPPTKPALVWSNTAYVDEADYLWIGHLVLVHWTRGRAPA